MIVFDVDARRLDVELSDDEIAERLRNVRHPEPLYRDGRAREVRVDGVVGLGRRDHAAALIGCPGSSRSR